MKEGRTDLIRDLERVATRMRRNAIRMTTEAGSGHPTTSMSAADVVAALFFHALRFDVKNPSRAENDRFVLSKGHRDGVVTLFGVVPSPEAKKGAAEEVLQVPGVERVENELQVVAPIEQPAVAARARGTPGVRSVIDGLRIRGGSDRVAAPG